MNYLSLFSIKISAGLLLYRVIFFIQHFFPELKPEKSVINMFIPGFILADLMTFPLYPRPRICLFFLQRNQWGVLK